MSFAVPVRGVDHDALGQVRRRAVGERLAGLLGAELAPRAAAQDDVTVGVAAGVQDRRRCRTIAWMASFGAYWRRPQAYLDPAVRGAISTFGKIGDVEPGLAQLRRDLEDGTWTRRHGPLLTRSALDLGLRLAVSHLLPLP